MTTTRPPCQWELAFPTPDPGEAAGRHGQEAEMVTAAPGPESPAVSEPRSPLNPPNRRGTDPYARWCGRGGTARCPPIPIYKGMPSDDHRPPRPTAGLHLSADRRVNPNS